MAADNEISVKVTADADGLIDVFGKATVEVSRLSAQLQKLDSDAFSGLSDAFKKGELDADEFRDALHHVTAEAQQMAAAVKLANSINGEAGQAAQLSAGGLRELVVVGRELASGNFTRLPGSLSILATRLGGIPPQAILAAAGIAAVGYAIYEAINSSQEFEAKLATIQNSLTAIGEGNSFDRSEITNYIDEVRQIPGVSRDAAESITNEFSRVQNSHEVIDQLSHDLNGFAQLIGDDNIPNAAKKMAEAFNDPVRGLKMLKDAGVEVSAATQEQVRQMMAVNDVAGAQQALFDGISEAMSRMVDNTSGLTKYWNDFKLSLSGVNEEAAKTRDSLLAMAAAAEKAGDPSRAEQLRYNASMYESRTRNLPNSNWSGSSGTVQSGDQHQETVDREAQTKKDNSALEETNKLFDTGNSLLAEQEKHKHNIQVIQEGINAAERLGDDAALKRAYADLETENERFYGAKQPKDDSDQYAEAQAKAEAEAGDARIKTEQEVINEKLRLGEISTADAVKQLHELEAQEHEINLKRIADMRAVHARQGDRAGVATSDGEAAKENERDTQENSKIDTQGQQATRQAQETEIEGARRVADEKVRTAQEAMQLKVALGQMTAQQEIAAEIEAANQKHELDDQYYNSLLAQYAQDSAAYQKTLTEKLIAEQKFNQQVLQLRTKLATDSQKQETQLTRSITNGLNQTVNGVLTGTQTMGQAFQRMGQNIVLSVVEGALDKIVTKWLSNNSTIEAAQNALDSFLGIANQNNAQTTEQTLQESTNLAINDYAAQGAAAATASTAAIPIIGPELAPAAGAAMFAEIQAYNVASAAGGWVVPSDQLAMVHENEMILPAHLSQGISGMIANGQQGGGSGHVFNNTFHVNAGDGITAKQLPDMIVKTMSKAMRNGQFGGMRSA